MTAYINVTTLIWRGIERRRISSTIVIAEVFDRAKKPGETLLRTPALDTSPTLVALAGLAEV